MNAAAAALFAAALLIRVLVSISPYSGAQTPPKYGDYEAQRHWMELTTNLPVQQWYKDGPDNDPKYWPLDYPPLSGYQSYVHGLFVKQLDPAAVALHSSRGYETYFSKQLLRWTVILSDLLIFFPAAYLASAVFSSDSSSPAAAAASPQQQQRQQLFVLAAVLLQPASIIVDHGHFQYNCISLALAVLAAVAIAKRKDVLGSVLFCLSLNHKQMGLFYAPAFFAHLLGRCLQQLTYTGKVLGVARLGVTVIATFVVCWSPWLTSLDSASQVLRRIFPVGRGLFEDYLANFWCVTSVFIKWKSLASNAALMPVCAGLTVLAALPSMVQQVLQPSPKGLLLGMANSAFAFFMLSYQVHEKSILLPLLPITLLAASEPDCAIWGPAIASFSMYPLLVRDGVSLAYTATIVLYLLVITALVATKGVQPVTLGSRCGRLLAAAGCAGAVLLHLLQALVPPPQRLPWLHDRLFVSYSFVFIAGAMLYLNWRQWNQQGSSSASKAKTK
ncbi:hypothetical protein OEZ86_006565 [Tetradesmus obliquus]|nr:hypothetical protein OEZ86_006565 [Tetradesmus obliquus]